MANYLPQASGLWSTTTWITAFSNLTALAGNNTPPTSIDDVYADGKSITIDTNINVLSLRTTTSPRTGGLAGGGYFINNGISLSAASVIPGTTTCLTFLSASPNTCTVVGNISGSATTTSVNGLLNNSTGTINLFGSMLGGSVAGAQAVQNTSGTLRVVFTSCRGGTNSTGYGINNTGTVFATGGVISPSLTPGGAIGLLQTGGSLNYIGNALGTIESAAIQLTNNSSVAYISGNITGGAANNAMGLTIANVNTDVIIEGSITGGTGGGSGVEANGVRANSFRTLIISGNISGGTTTSSNGLRIVPATGTVRLTSVNITGGSGSSSYGVSNDSTNTILITGTSVGGTGSSAHGIYNNTGGIVSIEGTVQGGINSGVGLFNNGTGTVFATKAIGNSFGLGSAGITAGTVGLANSQNGRAYVEQAEFGSRGFTPVSGPVYILPSNRNTLVGYTTATGTPVTFYNSLSVSGLMPPASSVRLGTVYNVGNSVGTMAVPSASAVEFGVPVDNTVGVAALTPQTVWGYSRLSATDVGSMGDRLRNAATAQSVGSQIASFNL